MTNPSGADHLPNSTTASSTSIWEDFVDIFTSPSAVFARRENGGFWMPLIIVTLAISILFIATKGLMQPVFDADFARGAAAAMRKNPQLTEEQIATMRSVQEKILYFAPLIFVPIGIFITAAALWLIGKLFDAAETYRTAVVVTAYAFIPRILEVVVSAVQAMLMDPASLNGRYAVSLGVGRFINPDTSSPFLIALLGRVDVFTIWITVLLAIGLSVTGRIPRARAAMAAACVWVIGALPALLGALRS
ncbi:MAG: YIP1 family protein [Gemmatimonadota bacterium]|nr:YIP1 family protein [Gemmatimonadota bacterium]